MTQENKPKEYLQMQLSADICRYSLATESKVPLYTKIVTS